MTDEYITVKISEHILVALTVFTASDDEVREHIRHMMIEIGKEEVRIVASDGCILACYRQKMQETIPDNTELPISAWIPISAFFLMKEWSETDVEIRVSLLSDGHVRKLMVDGEKRKWYGLSFDHDPLNYRKCIPESSSGEGANYSFPLVKRLRKAFRIFHKEEKSEYFFGPAILCNGEKAAFVDFRSDDFAAIIMPFMDQYRTQAETMSWAKQPIN